MTNNTQGPDWQGIGYLVSSVSVLLLGAVAWPTPSEPRWMIPAVVIGCATSVIGMGLRYIAHVQQKRAVAKAEREARQANGAQRSRGFSGA
jgi:hypothetical protein